MSKVKTIHKNTCPDKNDFNTYLNHSGSLAFIKAFEAHINECPLCQAALEGYKLSFLDNLEQENTTPTIRIKTSVLFISIAASIIILLTAGFLLNGFLQKKNSYYAMNEVPLYSYQLSGMPHQKALSHKSNSEFWSVNQHRQLKVNDQIIAFDELEQVIKASEPAVNAIYLEIEGDDSEFALQLIATIKSKTTIPVYPYATKKGIKKTNLRR